MNNFRCIRCGYETSIKTHIRNHINYEKRIEVCPPLVKDVDIRDNFVINEILHICNYCGKSYKKHYNKNFHENNCEVKKELIIISKINHMNNDNEILLKFNTELINKFNELLLNSRIEELTKVINLQKSFSTIKNSLSIEEMVSNINNITEKNDIKNNDIIGLKTIPLNIERKLLKKEIEEKKPLIKNNPKKLKNKDYKAFRIILWDKYFGRDSGTAKCMCCNVTVICQQTFECGHIVASSNGGEVTLENIKPICSTCNKSMRTYNMDEFIAHILRKNKSEKLQN